MHDKYRRIRRKRKPGEFRSKQEELVDSFLTECELPHAYEKGKFSYTLTRKYTPDFLVHGDHPFFIEVKGYFPPEARAKLLATVICNPDLQLFVALQTPHKAINKNSKTSYALWCQKHGIPWCPLPIPPNFLVSWVTGQRLTYRVQTQKDAEAQMELQLMKTAASIASPVTATSPSVLSR